MADVFEVLKQDHDEVNRMLTDLRSRPMAMTGATSSQLEARRSRRCGRCARRPSPRRRPPTELGTQITARQEVITVCQGGYGDH